MKSSPVRVGIWSGIFLLITLLQVIDGEQINTLDVEQDLRLGWKTENLIYILHGTKLFLSTYVQNPIKSDQGTDLQFVKMPKGFSDKLLRDVPGIWIARPYLREGERSHPTNMSISFHTSAQLLSKIQVKYCIGGNARLDIRSSSEFIANIPVPSPVNYTITLFGQDLQGTSNIQLVGQTSTDDDFILIDAVYVHYFEPSTTTPKSTTTTAKTTAKTTATPYISHASSLCSSTLVGFVVMLCFLYVKTSH